MTTYWLESEIKAHKYNSMDDASEMNYQNLYSNSNSNVQNKSVNSNRSNTKLAKSESSTK